MKIFQENSETSESDDEYENNEKLEAIYAKENALISAGDNIFTLGCSKLPIKSIQEAKFTKNIHANLWKHGYRSIFSTQSYSFNEILAGRYVTIINSRNSGKTISYLPALLTLISNDVEEQNFNRDQDDIKMANLGPICVIINRTSREVELMYKLCQIMLSQNDMKITKAAGAWNLEEIKVKLLNGCDLLITTPSCFMRLTECDTIKLFDRQRIKYVVLENLDLILDAFETEIQHVVTEFFTNMEEREKNPQLIITASRFVKKMTSYIKISLSPVVLIGDFIEAALFCKSTFLISRDSIKEKQNGMVNYLLQYKWIKTKTMIVFKQQDELDEFKQLLLNNAIGHATLDSNSSFNQIDSMSKKWVNEDVGRMSLLLITDEILKSFNVDCVEILIHYSLPSTWTEFSRRFGACIGFYNSYVRIEPFNSKNKPSTIVLLDEKNVQEIPRLIDFIVDRHAKLIVSDEIVESAKVLINK